MDNNLSQCTGYSPVCNKTPKIVHYVLNRVLFMTYIYIDTNGQLFDY